MDSEDAVERDFTKGGLSYIGAIERLQGMGIEAKEAERMVGEWADAADAEERDRREANGQFGVGA
jgi:hypothetical protein